MDLLVRLLPFSITQSISRHNYQALWFWTSTNTLGLRVIQKTLLMRQLYLSKGGGAHTQLPLKMTWALTIHKSQGMTLPMTTLDIGNVECQALTFTTISKSVILKGPTHIPDIHL